MNSFHVTGNHISELPAIIGQLQYLQSLHLGENDFTTFPEVLFRCPQLRKLNLNGNQLTTIPKRIAEMQKLEDTIKSFMNEPVSKLNQAQLSRLFTYHQWKDGMDWEQAKDMIDHERLTREFMINQLVDVFGLEE